MLDFAIFAVTFLLALVGAVLYLYPASRPASGIPGLTPTEEKDGNLPDIVNSGSLHEFLVNLHERYGPVVSFWFGRRLVVSLGTADALKQHFNPNKTSDPFETMLKSLLGYPSGGGSAGEDHVRRRLYGGAVAAALQSNFPLLIKLSEELLDKWLSYPETQHISLSQHMLGFALKFVTRMVLGSTFEDEQEVIRFQKIHGTVWSEIGKGFLDGSLDKNTTRKKQYQEALMQLESTLKKIIKERKGGNFSQHTFIDSLVQGNLNEQQPDPGGQCVILSGRLRNNCKARIISLVPLSKEADEGAGEMAQWLRALTAPPEVLSSIPSNHMVAHNHLVYLGDPFPNDIWRSSEEVIQGDRPSFREGSYHFRENRAAQYQKKKLNPFELEYCRQVLFETVRTAKLTPVSARLQDIEGKVGPFVIPKECEFDPDRFADEPVMKVFSSLGFSGTWECPELRFAYMVATVLVCVLLKRLHLLAVETQVFEMKYELVTSPREEAWITVSKRH
ncbi:Cytochrome P450 20A1 [Apodemus speciosus]|uniref:Cytochrome P450 20A1 n=1 Tax=Apodemus speciosus TaxID=105296 RepID=A0ABQ0ED05_APOSI